MNAIEINNLVKKYKDHVAVNGISLSVEEGEIFGFLGPNGAGKSTTINTVVGILKRNEGSIKIFDMDIDKEREKVKKLIGYVPQDFALFNELSAYDNVIYWGKIYGLRGSQLKSAVQEALEFTGLWERKKDKPKQFSGGMKRRLNIACAIVHKPKLLFMDEPTAGVDPQSRNNILESIRTLNHNGTTVIYTSHYMEEVEAICNKVAIIDFGKIIAVGTIDELVNDSSKEEKAEIEITDLSLKTVEFIKRLNGVASCERNDNIVTISVNKNYTSVMSVVKEIMSKNIDIASINVERANLETVFLSLTGKKLRD